jgi:hypothetical protein
MRLSDLENPQVVERLKVHESTWNNAKNEWAFSSEEESFREKGPQTFSPEVICAYIHRILSAGWGFPVWAATALMRALRLRLSE